MNISNTIYKLRTEAKLTQGQFAEIFGVSQQCVQKWESGSAVPDLDKIIKISKWFDISLDAIILGNDNRIVEEMKGSHNLKPQYQNIHDWDFYAANLAIEYKQSVEEGLNIENYKDVFAAVAKLPRTEIKKKLGDVLFEVVTLSKTKAGYEYFEPSELTQIKSLRTHCDVAYVYDENNLKNKIHGAWMGRICGCMLGKTVEGIRTDELTPFLKQTNNYPLSRYIYKSDLSLIDLDKYKYNFYSREYADQIDGMPVDDDTNYVVLAQELIEHYGKDFTPYDVSAVWLKYQGKDAYCTAERVAYCNFVNGYAPPESAIYKNPYREWIGAQIRGDYFGYINPGNPELAAEMAWRDACISHVKNGIYGEMFVAAMLAVAACTDNIKDIILGGLNQIPYTSRLYKNITDVINAFENAVSQKAVFAMIHDRYDEFTDHGWCHVIPNAMIVAASLLYGNGDFGKSICMAVQTGFDTDCNGATVGSILGMAKGINAIPDYWQKPINNRLHTSIFSVETVQITDRVYLTLQHVAKIKE